MIIVGGGLLVFVLATLVAGSAWLHAQHRSELAEIELSARTAALLEDAQLNVTLANLLLERYVNTGNETAIPAIRANMATVMDSLAVARSQEEMRGDQGSIGVDDEAELAALDRAAAEAATLTAFFEQVIALWQSGDTDGARQVLEAAEPEVAGFSIGIGAATALERQEVSALRSRADRTSDLAFWFTAVVGAIGTASGLVVLGLIVLSIVTPLSSLESTALTVGVGSERLAQTGEPLRPPVGRDGSAEGVGEDEAPAIERGAYGP